MSTTSQPRKASTWFVFVTATATPRRTTATGRKRHGALHDCQQGRVALRSSTKRYLHELGDAQHSKMQHLGLSQMCSQVSLVSSRCESPEPPTT